MKSLVIGGTGVLSRAVVDRLVSTGDSVTMLTDGRGVLPAPDGIFSHIIVDRNDMHRLTEYLASSDWDLIVDCVCYNSDQAQYLYSATNGRAKHTIVISTSILYDRHAPLPYTSETPLAPHKELGKYGCGKAEMEAFWLGRWEKDRYPVTILRLPHILGVGAELGIVPLHNRDPFILHRLRKGMPLILADGGRQILQAVFNEDVADVIVATRGKTVTFGRVYNCANPSLFTAEDYYATIANRLGCDLAIEAVPSEVIWKSEWGWGLNALSRIVSMDTLLQDVGIVPSTSLEEAIQATFSFVEDRPSEQLSDDGLEDFLRSLANCSRRLSEELSACSPKRTRTQVDLRMNTVPPRLQ